MKNKIIAILSAALLCFGGMCGITAHANYDSTAAAPAATETPKPARTISTAGAGHVVDNISDSDKLQFISVTAKDGSVFFLVLAVGKFKIFQIGGVFHILFWKINLEIVRAKTAYTYNRNQNKHYT